MDKLNYYCLENICKYLNCKDSLNFLQYVNKDLCFEKLDIDKTNWKEFTKNIPKISYVKEMNLNFYTRNFLEIFKKNKIRCNNLKMRNIDLIDLNPNELLNLFKNVNSMELTDYVYNDNYSEDLSLTKLKNLKKLTLKTSDRLCKRFWKRGTDFPVLKKRINFPENLEELEIEGGINLIKSNIGNLLKIKKLKVSFCISEFSILFDLPPNLENLILNIDDVDYRMSYDHRCIRFETPKIILPVSLKFLTVTFPVIIKNLSKLTNLKTVIMFDDNIQNIDELPESVDEIQLFRSHYTYRYGSSDFKKIKMESIEKFKCMNISYPIEELPINYMQNLKILLINSISLSENITELDLSPLKSLLKFRMTCSRVKKISLPTSLIKLEMDYTKTLIIKNIDRLVNLTTLSLPDCGIKKINLPVNLENVDLSHNYYIHIVNLSKLTKLKILNIGYCGGIKNVEFPSNIEEIKMMESVKQKGSYNLKLEHLTKLKYLNAARCRVRSIDLPSSIEILNISNNEHIIISGMNKEVDLTKYKNLKKIDISQCLINNITLPLSLITLKMSTLCVRKDEFEVNIKNLYNLLELRWLDILGCYIKNLFLPVNLKYLVISYNNREDIQNLHEVSFKYHQNDVFF